MPTPANNLPSNLTRRRVVSGAGLLAAAGALGTARPAIALPDQLAIDARSATREAFDEIDAGYNDGEGDSDATEGVLSWAQSNLMVGYVSMYRATRDPYYLDKFIVHGDRIMGNRDHILGLPDYRGQILPAWGNTGVTFDGSRMVIGIDTGNITFGFSCFCRVIAATPELRSHPRYGAKADEYLAAIREAVAVHDEDYELSADGTGTYWYRKGCAYVVDGIQYPVNMNLSLGRTLWNLWHLTGEDDYRTKAAGLANRWDRDFYLIRGGAVWAHQHKGSWPYIGWEPEDEVSVHRPSFASNHRVEDLGHGACCVEFADLTHRAGVWGRRRPMQLARTMNDIVFTTDDYGDPTVYERIDGDRADAGKVKQEGYSGHWLCLAPYGDPSQPARTGQILDQNLGPDSAASPAQMSQSVGYLNLVARGGEVGDYRATPPIT